ncbi:MAG: threonine--tRNA ligase [Candidatus Gracilibacteria bacterium]
MPPRSQKPEATDPLYGMRHSCAHMLAQAVLQVFPDAKLGVGPVIDNGFYYDFQLSRALTPEDVKDLQKRMEHIGKQNQTFVRQEKTMAEAKEFLKAMPSGEQVFKIELVNDFAEQGSTTVTFYENVDQKNEVKFVDLCRGNHTETTGKVGAFQLTTVASAYWKGDSANPSMQRIYGVCFATPEELKDYMMKIEEAKKRDHKVLGKQLGLFAFSPLVGAGLPLFLPKGARLKRTLEDFITNEKEKRGYSFVNIPHIAKDALYVTSGHLGKYDAMMPVMEVEDGGDKLVMKAMNCPHHFELFKAEPHSYRDLPLRFAENTTVYRNEKSGEVNGLFRVRAVTQDDTHHFVRHDQIGSEMDMILGLTKVVYEKFGFKNFRARVSVRDPAKPEKYFGDDALWDLAEKNLVEGVQRWGAEYFIGEGEAAFYGPKIDLMVEDALGREWQLTTVQLDFTQPENFDLTYTGEDGKPHRPAVLHAAILGSYERFMGIVIEHFGGAFPAWLAPVQVRILPVSDQFLPYATEVFEKLRSEGVRVEMDSASDTLGKKIRNAEHMRMPYMIVIGEKETTDKTVAVRDYATKKQETMSVDDLLKLIRA